MKMSETGVIREGGAPVAQVDLVQGAEGKASSARLYTSDGVFLAECPYAGDNDAGYAVGMALYRGYRAGQDNRELEMRKAVEAAFRQKGALSV